MSSTPRRVSARSSRLLSSGLTLRFPPAAICFTAVRRSATLPSWKYGAVRLTLRSVGVRNLYLSASALLASKRP